MDMRHLCLLGCAMMVPFARAALVARWDFNNYDGGNRKSANILKATVGSDGVPAKYDAWALFSCGSKAITDGTIGALYVVAPDYDGDDPEARVAASKLGEGNYALAVPLGLHVQLPIPDALREHPFTIQIRFYIPKDHGRGNGYCSFFNRSNLGTGRDGDLFVNPGNYVGGGEFNGREGNYSKSVTRGEWHTLTFSQGAARGDVFLDEATDAIRWHDGGFLNYFKDYDNLLLCSDNGNDDNLIYIDYVAFYDSASVYESKLPHYSKAGLTGEWTFPADNPLRATVGRDLEYYVRTGPADFPVLTNCLAQGDSGLRVGQNRALKCRHDLPADADYSVVMDIRIPEVTGVAPPEWHAIFQPRSKNDSDASLFVRLYESMKDTFIFKWSGASMKEPAFARNEWIRLVITHQSKRGSEIGSYTWCNGVKRDWNINHNPAMDPKKGDFFLLLADDNGADPDVDISYAALYDRVLSDDEIRELHARPLAQKADGAFIPMAVPVGIWRDVSGAFDWSRPYAPSSATYVFDLTLPERQPSGGILVQNDASLATGVYGTGSGFSSSLLTTTHPECLATSDTDTAWGGFTENALDRSAAHRVAVVWAGATHRVHYYVDGVAWGQFAPTAGDAALAPSGTMRFLNGLDAAATRVAAYDRALTPDEVAALGGVGGESPDLPPVPTLTHDATSETRSGVDEVTFTFSVAQEEGAWVLWNLDFGDGSEPVSGPAFEAPGATRVVRHLYRGAGPYMPVLSACTQGGAQTTANGAAITPKIVPVPAAEVLSTWPWQQNVYTNRFTIMCETKVRQNDLELQWGEDYAQRTPMTYVGTSDVNFLYKARVDLSGRSVIAPYQPGSEIPYRLGIDGVPLTYTTESENTAGTVRLWDDDPTASFTCAVWGDNQEGARSGDWDADRYRFIRAIFDHMVARNVDFGLSTGDMSTKANYASQIKPGTLVGTNARFGRTRPYYVVWGNHDQGYPAIKRYFENVSLDDPDYRSSEDGNGYLYRNNVLFIFLDQSMILWKETMDWLERLLETERAKQAKFRIILRHLPIFGDRDWGVYRQRMNDIIREGRVDIVLSGHMHGYERIEKDGFIQLTNGCAGYLDHPESIVCDYGDATRMGGHRNIPYLWARQKSAKVGNVLGAAEPVRMGCLHGWGELSVKGDTLTYKAHGFNADGSYIGVFDVFELKSKRNGALGDRPLPTMVGADSQAARGALGDRPLPASTSIYGLNLTAPVNNATWKVYKDAIGEPFDYPEGTEANAVVNVTKTEIEAFCAWLKDTTGTTYHLPTRAELQDVFGGQLARDVSEWTSSVDPSTGWCLILGGNTNAVEGTWCRPEDTPAIQSADCHANYLGFRLLEGSAPIEPADPLAAPLDALEKIADPAEVYAWRNGQLEDITSEWKTPVAHTYDVPVIFARSGELAYENDCDIALNAGFAAPRSFGLHKTGRGALVVKGPVRGGISTNAWCWTFASGGSLTLEDVRFTGLGCGLASGDRTVRLVGTNDFARAWLTIGANDHRVTTFAGEGACLKAGVVHNLSAPRVVVEDGVTLALTEDFRVDDAFELIVDGVLDANGVNVTKDSSPWYLGSGTLRTTYFGNYYNSRQRLGVSNIVLTSGFPWRTNRPNSTDRYDTVGADVRLTSLRPWTIDHADTWGCPYQFFADSTFVPNPKLVFAGRETVRFNPAGANVDLEVAGGTVLLKNRPTSGAMATSGTGAWGIDDELSLTIDQTITGAFRAGGTLKYAFGSQARQGIFPVLFGSGLKKGDIAVQTDVDESRWTVREVWSESGDLFLDVWPAGVPRPMMYLVR